MKLILLILIAALALSILIFTSKKDRAPQQTKSETQQFYQTTTPKTRLSLNQEGSSKSQTTFLVSAKSEKEILAIDLYLRFNPQKLQFIDIKPSDIFTSPMVFKKSIDSKKGELFFAVGSLKPSKLTGTVAKVTFAVKDSQTISKEDVILLKEKIVASLKGAQKATIEIQQ